MTLVVDDFTAEQLDGVLGLCTAAGWPTLPSDPGRALRALLASGTATVVAVTDDGTVIGFAHALSDGVTAYLAELLVDPGHRRRGVGRQLVLEVAQRCGAARLDLLTDTAEGFYTAVLPHRRYHGFRPYPRPSPTPGASAAKAAGKRGGEDRPDDP
ncbi:MAG: GNAT family N-acetyltransferase [Pseudonocardiaceae bacterium]